MRLSLPSKFLERLKRIIPSEFYPGVERSFSDNTLVVLRINTLKISRAHAMEQLRQMGFDHEEVSWCPEAVILKGPVPSGAANPLPQDIFYRQSLSSMVPVIALDPVPGERVLDFCAAPGSKTTQIAARMLNQGDLIAVEAIRSRFFRLKAVCELMGASQVSCKLTDARRFRADELFDRVLVDAPCSSEGRFRADDPATVGYWSERKIKEMTQKQRGLLLSAGLFVKPGGVLVYSTCTFAPEENEGVVDWFLRKSGGVFDFAPIDIQGIPNYPLIGSWGEKVFRTSDKGMIRVLPGGPMEGFFVAKFEKIL